MWCTQANTILQRSPYFPCQAASRALWILWLWHWFCLVDELNVPLSWSWRAVLWVRSGCQVDCKLFIFKITMTDTGTLILPPSLSPQLLPSITNRISAWLATTRILPLPPPLLSSSSCFSFLYLKPPPTRRWRIQPQASGTSTVTTRRLDKLATVCLWPSSNVLE